MTILINVCPVRILLDTFIIFKLMLKVIGLILTAANT